MRGSSNARICRFTDDRQPTTARRALPPQFRPHLGRASIRRRRGKLEGMLFDLVTLVLAPVMWIGGYVGYHAQRPFTRTKRLWLLVAAILTTVACSASIVGLTAGPSGVLGAVIDAAGGISLLLEASWFVVATRRGARKLSERGGCLAGDWSDIENGHREAPLRSRLDGHSFRSS